MRAKGLNRDSGRASGVLTPSWEGGFHAVLEANHAGPAFARWRARRRRRPLEGSLAPAGRGLLRQGAAEMAASCRDCVGARGSVSLKPKLSGDDRAATWRAVHIE